jgi:hypothetical protein
MIMATEAHIQGIARFLVGFGTEEDDKWRDYHFDFCGHIDYDPHSGAPVNVSPIENSGYSVGCLQLDFGQTTAAAEPFVTAFDAWHQANPGSLGLVSSHKFAVDALKCDGQTLKANPASALHQQDVEALSAFVLSPDGSDWVNAHIDNALIGSDTQKRCIYDSEYTLVGIAREMEVSSAFKNANSATKTDLLYAMTMKAYNQAPGNCTNKLLPFLDTNPSDDDIIAWPNKFSGAFQDGVGNAVKLSQMWSKLITPAANWTPPSWLLDLGSVMDAQCLANPRKVSAASGPYVAAKQVFESSGYFPGFAQALQAGKNFIPSKLFDATGAIRVVPQTGRVTQGVMVKNKIGYVWDTASNAFQWTNRAWTPIAIGTINNKQTMFERLQSFVREMLPSS